MSNHSCKMLEVLKNHSIILDRFGRGQISTVDFWKEVDKFQKEIDGVFIRECEMVKLKQGGY